MATILLVDNIPDHRAAYSAALESHGYRVHAAESGRAAMELAHLARPDCAVVDVRLPDMSGWDLCQQIKSHASTRETPVVVLTPDTSRSHAAESARVHCNAWLAQPSKAEDLVRAVNHVLEQRQSSPRSAEEAVLGVAACPACESDHVRATLRVSPIQYYLCRSCGHGWRIEAV